MKNKILWGVLALAIIAVAVLAYISSTTFRRVTSVVSPSRLPAAATTATAAETAQKARVAATSKSVSDLTSALSTLNTNYNKSETTSSKTGTTAAKNSADQMSAKIKERADLMEQLMAEDPTEFLKVAKASAPTVIELAKTQAKYKGEVAGVGDLESAVNIKNAKVTVLHGDDFEKGESSYFYKIDDGTQKTDLYLTSPVITSVHGANVDMKGYAMRGKVAASTNKTDGFTVRASQEDEFTNLMVGKKKITFLLVNFRSASESVPQRPFTAEQYQAALTKNPTVNKFFQESSHGRLTYEYNTLGWFDVVGLSAAELGGNFAQGGSISGRCVDYQAEAVSKILKENNITLSTNQTVIFHSNVNCGRGGWAGGVMINIVGYALPSSNSLDLVVAHELGHTLGMGHSSSWGSRGLSEYGNGIDLMGNFTLGAGMTLGQQNNGKVERRQWINNDNILQNPSSGVYKIRLLSEDYGYRGIKLTAPTVYGVSSGNDLFDYRLPTGYNSIVSTDRPIPDNAGGLTAGFSGELFNGEFLSGRVVALDGFSGSRLYKFRYLDFPEWNEDVVLDTFDFFIDAGSTYTTSDRREINILATSSNFAVVSLGLPTGGGCSTNPPELLWAGDRVVSRGAVSTHVVELFNTNSRPCASSTYQVAVSGKPTGWSVAVVDYNSGKPLNPGQWKNVGLVVSAPANATLGTNSVTLTISEKGAVTKTHTVTVSFTVVPDNAFHVTAPLAGKNVSVGGTLTIPWSASDIPANGKMKIDLVQNGEYGTGTLVPVVTTAGSGSFVWTVPDSVRPGAYYLELSCKRADVSELYCKDYYDNGYRTRVTLGPVIITPGLNQPVKKSPDLNGDGLIDATDVALLNAVKGRSCASDVTGCPADINIDGKIDDADLGYITRQIVRGRFSLDINRDGFVSATIQVPSVLEDYSFIKGIIMRGIPCPAGVVCDWDGDGRTTVLELGQVANYILGR